MRQNKYVLNICLTLVIVFRQFKKIWAGLVSSFTQHICCCILQYLFIFSKYKLSKKHKGKNQQYFSSAQVWCVENAKFTKILYTEWSVTLQAGD